jgi:hypothetical protein
MGMVMLTLIVLASCSSKKANLTAIPKDAGFIMVFDGKALSSKSGVDDFTQTKAYNKLISELSEDEMSHLSEFEYIFKDTKESGFGINDEFIFFTKMDDGNPSVGLVFSVLDRSKLDMLMKRLMDDEETDVEIVEDADISTIMLPDDEGVFAWNDNQFLILAHEELAAEALLNEAKALLKQSNSESINANKTYADFYEKKKDISLWFDYDMISKNMPPAQQMMIASQLPFNMSGTSMNAYISFEKGKVVAKYESVLNDEMKKIMEDYKFINDDFDTDVLKMLPKVSYANLEISINLFDYYHMFIDMYKEKQVNTEMYTKQVEQEVGMTIDEILNSFSGEMAISLHGIRMAEKTSSTYAVNESGELEMQKKTSLQPELLYSAVIKYNNDKIWNLIEEKASEMGLKKTGGYYSIPQANISIAYINSTMLITNDSVLIQKELADGSIDPNMKSTEVASHLKSFPSYMELNMDIDEYPEDFIKYIKEEGENYSDGIFNILSTYKSLKIIPTDIYSAKIVLELKDDSKNSLDIILHNMDETTDLISKN